MQMKHWYTRHNNKNVVPSSHIVITANPETFLRNCLISSFPTNDLMETVYKGSVECVFDKIYGHEEK